MAGTPNDPDARRGVTTRAWAARLRRAAVGLALMAPAVLEAQQAPATIVGTLLNRDSRLPVEGARIAVLGTGLAVSSDATGRFRIGGVAAGVRVLQVRAVGFAIGSWLLQLDEGQVARHEFVMEPRVYELTGVAVTAAPSTNWRSEAAFERRRAQQPGFFISRNEIANRRPDTLADLLRGVPGVSTTCSNRACQVIMQRSTRRCSPEYFLDGHQATNATGASFPINQIRGVEVYRSEFETPVEFQRFNLNCGVIAIWTIDPGERFGRQRDLRPPRDSVPPLDPATRPPLDTLLPTHRP